MIENNVESAVHANELILDTGTTWVQFCTRINELILDSNIGMASSEDKRLGAYFVRPEDWVFNADEYNPAADATVRRKAKMQNHLFPEKVLKYLWDDAFKFSRDAVFAAEYSSLEWLINDFSGKRGFARFSVFKK